MCLNLQGFDEKPFQALADAGAWKWVPTKKIAHRHTHTCKMKGPWRKTKKISYS